jgi:hypothetical protein
MLVFEGSYDKTNTIASTFQMSFRLGTADGSEMVGSGFFAVTNNSTSFTNFFINHGTNTDGATGTGFTTSSISASRTDNRIHFSAFIRVVSGTTILARIRANASSSGFILKRGSGMSIIKVA